MSRFDLYEDRDEFEDIFGDLDFTLLRSNEKHLVFVYGTMMKGMRNYHRLLDSKVISQHAHTPFNEDYWMSTRQTDGGYPAPIATRGQPTRPKGSVFGEIYEIDNDTLLLLDQMEGHPAVYRREKVSIQITELKPQKDYRKMMWMYLYTGDHTDSRVGIHAVKFTNHATTFKWTG